MSDFYDLNSPCLSALLSPEAMGSHFHVIFCISWAHVYAEYSCNILKVVRHVAALFIHGTMSQETRAMGQWNTKYLLEDGLLPRVAA